MGCQASRITSLEEETTKEHKRKRVGCMTKYSEPKKQNVSPGSFQMNEQDVQMIFEILAKHMTFSKLTKTKRKEFINDLECFQAKSQQVLFRKGQNSNLFFIIRKGKIEISTGVEGQQKYLVRGDCFGDLGLLYSSTRSATAMAVEDSEFFCLSQKEYRRKMLEIIQMNHKENQKYLSGVKLFQNLNKKSILYIAYKAKQLTLPKDAIIFHEGDQANCLYILKKGRIVFQAAGREDIELKIGGQFFGESCLQQGNQKRLATAKCLQPTQLLCFTKNDIIKQLSNNKSMDQIQIDKKIIWAIRRDQKIGGLPNQAINKMVDRHCCQLISFKNGDVIAKKGQKIKHLIMSLDGKVNDQPQVTIFNTQYLDEDFHQIVTATLKKVGDGRVCLINIKEFEKMFGCSMKDIMKKKSDQLQTSLKHQKYFKSLELKNFNVLQILGKGYFGTLLHIQQKQTQIQFALRSINKDTIQQQQMVESINSLRKMSQQLKSPFICKCYRTFKDDNNVYFLYKYIQGITLFELSKSRDIHFSLVQHFVACIIYSLQFLHSKSIVYRDLKVQNLVVDNDGYVHLVDFMIAKDLNSSANLRTYTIVGTPHYMAPEIFEGEGYSLQADLWSLGVIIYFMIKGQYPYGDQIDNQYRTKEEAISMEKNSLVHIYEQIKTKELFYEDYIGGEITQLIGLLLDQNHVSRSEITFTQLKNMAFFQDYDWSLLAQRKARVPFMIKKEKPKNTVKLSFEEYVQKENTTHTHRTVNKNYLWDEQF